MNKFDDNLDILSLDRCNNDQISDTLLLIETVFKYPKDQHFKVDFHLLFNKENFKNCWVLFDKNSNQVIAHIGYLIKEFADLDKVNPIALIGGVAVHTSFQKKGIFKKFFNFILEKLDNITTHQLLWSEHSQLFNKFNFYEAGRIYQYGRGIDIDSTKHCYKECNLKDLSNEHLEDLNKLYHHHYKDYTLLKRNLLDWEKIKNISSTRLFIKESNSKIESYFFYGKGADLSNIIIEGNIDLEQLVDPYCWQPHYLKALKPTPFFAAFFRKSNHYNEVTDISKKPIFISGLESI